MPFTVWNFPWGGPSGQPTFWGGGIEGYIGPDPLVPEDGAQKVALDILGTLWLAQDPPSDGVDSGMTKFFVGADSMGVAPGNMPEFNEGGNLTLVSFAEGAGTDLHVVRSDFDGSVPVRTGWAVNPGQVHAELFGDTAVTGLGGAPHPAFVMLEKSSDFDFFTTHNIPLSDLSSVNSALVWDNELTVDEDDVRMVSLETHGTVIVAVAPSTQFPGDTFWLKSTFGTGPSEPATEILIDIRPSEIYSTGTITRFHVVETHNRILLFYYEVTDEDGGSHTAYFAYTPVHDTYDDDLPFNADGVVRDPEIVLAAFRPIDAKKGARRNPVSNTIMVGLEPEETTVQGLEIHWFRTTGYGNSSFGVPIIWNPELHPHLFGGRLATAAPEREIRIESVGWSDARQGGIFPVVGFLRTREIDASAIDFENYYRSAVGLNDNVARMCLGFLYSPRTPSDSNPAGTHALRQGTIAPMDHNEYARNGYHMATDFFQVTSLLRLNDISGDVTAAEVGPNGDVTGGVVPTQGMVKGALYFYDEDASVEVPGQEVFDTDGVTISLWVFPENSGDVPPDLDDFTVAAREGGDEFVWRLWWREDSQTFRWQVKPLSWIANEISTAVLGVLPTKHWYHITAVYRADTGVQELYVNGFLVETHTFAGPSELAHATMTALPIFLGKETGSRRSFQGRIDDFAHADGAIPERIQAAYHYGLLSELNRPMRGSRTSEWRYQDQVVSTVSVAVPGQLGEYHTFAMRRVSMSPHTLLRNQLVIDVWKMARNQDEPAFLGLIPLPYYCYDRTSPMPTDHLGAPVTDDVWDSYELKAVRSRDWDDTTENVHLFYTVRGDQEGGLDPSIMILHQVVFPDDPAGTALVEAELALLFYSTPHKITAFDAVSRDFSSGTSDQLALIVAATDQTAAGSYLYLVRSQDFGSSAFSISNLRLVTNLNPLVSAAGNFFARDYSTAYATAGHPPIIRGIVSRRIEAGNGFPAGSIAINGVQIVYGVESVEGSALPAAAPTNQIVSTLHVAIPALPFDSSVLPAEFDLLPDGTPRQVDEYGIGGIQPFVPLSWLPHPNGLTGDSIMFGRAGTRAQQEFGRDGNGGLSVYAVPRVGFSALRVLALVGADWSPQTSNTIGASAVISCRPGTDDEDAVQVHVSRPVPDRSDKFSTVYVSEEEATSGGWTPATVGISVIPVLRRNDRASTVMFTGHRVTMRQLTDESPGGPIKVGDQYRYAVTMRWSFPGSTDFTP